ncbi:DinB family protein [Actinophytocola sp.]|uniref:DinB family protein n=1 Tax=Actinophytocola sp. TaxID=1872138 RepID=UPI002D804B2F|nr:DinB family protein [Actinophytocola sp.]HET9142202.1 DinB family protein [Actinophytocola sp.]
MIPSRVRPAPDADERSLLLGWLNLQRSIIHWKCEGLSEADAHRVVLPTSPNMTMAGLVSHLRWTEHVWFEVILLDSPSDPNPQFADEPDADMLVADVPMAQLLDDYARQCATADEIIAGLPLDTVARHARYGGATLRWILLHMLEETARHAGHADTIRELLDGTTGYY